MKSYKNGFTMIEIMLVVIMIGILAAMVVPSLSGRTQQARITAARADIDANLTTALDLYELDNGRYPTTEQGLKALVRKPDSPPVPARWNGPYLRKGKIPLDPWGQVYVYECPGAHHPEHFDLFSLGGDGMEGEDDVTNWETE